MRNGVVVSVASFARVLAALGHNVTIFTAQHPDMDGPEEGVFRFPSFTFPLQVVYPLALPVATGKARKLLKFEHFDIIHSHSPMLMGHVAVSYHRRRNIPLIFTYHTLMEEYTHYVPLPQAWVKKRAINLSREYSNTSDHVITPTIHVATRLRQYRVYKPISVIPTGIDLDLMDLLPDRDLRSELGIPAHAPLLAYAGRIALEKNIPRLISAFRLVLQQEPDTHLLLIGGGPEEPMIQQLCEDYGIADHVRMTGFVSRELVAQGLRQADVFIFASETETQGLVLGEAMACHVPVVAVNAEVTQELVTNGREGFLVPDADGPFADAILILLRDPRLRAEMGQRARQRAESISAFRCTERLVEIYQRTIEDLRWTMTR